MRGHDVLSIFGISIRVRKEARRGEEADERVEVGFAASDQRPHLTRKAMVSSKELEVCKIPSMISISF